MAELTRPTRNVALDNLRVVAMLLGLVTHGVLPHKATGLGRYPIRDCFTHVLADAAYFAVHDFRMQLFFLVAGFAATSLAARRGVRELVRNRLARVVLPLVLAVAVLTPVMHILFTYHEVDHRTGRVGAAGAGVPPLAVWRELHLVEWVGPNFHLWFLYYLALCSAVLAGWLVAGPRVLPAGLARAADRAFRWFAGKWWKTPVLAVLTIPLLWGMSDWWIDTPQGWLPDPKTLLYYLGFFLFGAMLARHADLLPHVGRRWPTYLLVANLVVLPLMLKLTISGNWAEDAAGSRPPVWMAGWKAAAIFLGGLYTWLTVEGLIGLFNRHFSGTRTWWSYLAGASYWCYLAGFPVQVALQVWLAEESLPIVAKVVLVNAATFAVLLASYELFVRRTWVGALLNGKRAAAPIPASVVAPRPDIPRPAGPRWVMRLPTQFGHHRASS